MSTGIAAIEKRYLGDSVYVEIERGMVKLTTDNGRGPSNTIYLEPEVMRALVQYYQDALEAVQRLSESPEDHL